MAEKLCLVPCKAPAVSLFFLEARGGGRGSAVPGTDFSGGREEVEVLAWGLCNNLPAPKGLCRTRLFRSWSCILSLVVFWDMINSAAAKVLFGSDYHQRRRTRNHKVTRFWLSPLWSVPCSGLGDFSHHLCRDPNEKKAMSSQLLWQWALV